MAQNAHDKLTPQSTADALFQLGTWHIRMSDTSHGFPKTPEERDHLLTELRDIDPHASSSIEVRQTIQWITGRPRGEVIALLQHRPTLLAYQGEPILRLQETLRVWSTFHAALRNAVWACLTDTHRALAVFCMDFPERLRARRTLLAQFIPSALHRGHRASPLLLDPLGDWRHLLVPYPLLQRRWMYLSEIPLPVWRAVRTDTLRSGTFTAATVHLHLVQMAQAFLFDDSDGLPLAKITPLEEARDDFDAFFDDEEDEEEEAGSE